MPRSSVSLVLEFRVRVMVRIRVRISLSHLRTIEPSDYRYTIVPSNVTSLNSGK